MLDDNAGALHRDSPSTTMIRVLVVDDQDAYRNVVTEVIDAIDGFVLVGSSPDSSNLTQDIARLRPDLLLLDVRMPDADGAEIAVGLRTSHPGLTVLLMSVFSSSEIPPNVFAAGIAFVEKENLDADVLSGLRCSILEHRTSEAGQSEA